MTQIKTLHTITPEQALLRLSEGSAVRTSSEGAGVGYIVYNGSTAGDDEERVEEYRISVYIPAIEERQEMTVGRDVAKDMIRNAQYASTCKRSETPWLPDKQNEEEEEDE